MSRRPDPLNSSHRGLGPKSEFEAATHAAGGGAEAVQAEVPPLRRAVN
jgi:hypothetical protein